MSEQGAEFGQVDLTDCDREPIHIPGSIQAHGVLLAFDPGLSVVVQVAGDTPRLLGLDDQQILGQPLNAVLGAAALTKVEAMIRKEQLLPRPTYLIETSFGGRLVEISAHLSGGLVILELAASVMSDGFDELEAVQNFSARAGSADSIASLTKLVVDDVAQVTGFDRVMFYRFREDDSGHVVAEHRRSENVESFLDLHYPASDIPVQARMLYCDNWIRTIPDVSYLPQPLHPLNNPLTGGPLDLSFSALRSVSPVHLEYLNNMGVAASISMSIMVGGKLWGLIACHHPSPRHIGARTRAALELFTQIVSLQIRSRLDLADSIARLRARDVQAQIAVAITDRGLQGLFGHEAGLLGLVPAAGVAVMVEGRINRLGTTPTVEEIKGVTLWLNQVIGDGVYSTDCLADRYPAAVGFLKAGAGLLALAISRPPGDYLLWFLPELISTVTWAGDPAKPVVHGPLGDRLTPRKSFAAWTETVQRRSRPWRPIEIESAAALQLTVLDVVLKQQIAKARAAELEAANRELDNFAYVASHDLKSPLRVIDNISGWLEQDLAAHLNEETRESMKMLRGRVKRMEKLLDDLVQYSLVGRTTEPTWDGMVGGDELVDDVLSLLSPPAVFNVTVNPGFAAIRLARMPLQQIFMNLIGNAIKHHHSAQGRIELTMEDREQEYAFAVKDDGPGIPAQYHDEIFNIFRTLKPRDQVEGSGMGLAMVRKHLAAVGGSVWLDSVEGGGSTFHFTWPKAKAEPGLPDTGKP